MRFDSVKGHWKPNDLTAGKDRQSPVSMKVVQLICNHQVVVRFRAGAPVKSNSQAILRSGLFVFSRVAPMRHSAIDGLVRGRRLYAPIFPGVRMIRSSTMMSALNQSVDSVVLSGSCQFPPVAHLDRALGFEPRGREFESLRAGQ